MPLLHHPREISVLLASAVLAATGCDCPVATVVYDKTMLLDEELYDPNVPVDEQCVELCMTTGQVEGCVLTAIEEEPAVSCTITASQNCGGIGRRPPGLAPTEGRFDMNALARHFSAAAHLEAASVPAFEIMARELAAHGAPRALRRRARRAAREEARHTSTMAALARRYGGRLIPPEVERRAVRSLEEVTLENAVEGCVRETSGAAVARWQSLHAATPRLRRTLRRIADDETRHAALSWDVHRWAIQRLPRGSARRIEREAAQVADSLRDGGREPDPTVRHVAGMPSTAARRRIDERLWLTMWEAWS